MKNTSFLFLLLILASCQKDDENNFTAEKNEILATWTPVDSVEADGKSTLLILAMINKQADKKNVRFLTVAGKFQDSTISYTVEANPISDDSLVAKAYLIPSLDVNPTVTVKVSVPTLEKSLNVRFVQAFPEQVQVESSVASLQHKFGSEAPVTSYITRAKGVPSLHQKVSFYALTSNNDTIGDFRAIDPAGSDNTGKVSAIFVLKDTLYTGKVRIIATAAGKDKPLTDVTTIFITQ